MRVLRLSALSACSAAILQAYASRAQLVVVSAESQPTTLSKWRTRER